MIIQLTDQSDSFLSGAECALQIRMEQLVPAIKIGETVEIDFSNVRGTSQSWMNALVMGALLECGMDSLKFLKFKHCNPLVKELITFSVQKAKQRSLQAA
ncbi:MAG: STAS-like domain-containing protein [Methyloglobulus sp.]|nr:STAS-like domain-containing protein [Methyloglobulus sp.]